MDAKIKFISGKSKSTIVDLSRIAPKLGHATIEKAFDAKEAGSSNRLDLFAVRESMSMLLHSSGGRPSLTGAGSQVKIPKIKKDWAKIDALALAASDLPHKPSPTQVAAIVLHLALSRISEQDIKAVLRKECA